MNLELNDAIINCALSEIEIILQNCNKSLSAFQDFPKITLTSINDISTKYISELNYNKKELKDKVKINYSKFNKDQKHIYDLIINRYNINEKINLFFINGAGGCGKTFLYNTLLAKVRSEGKIAIAMASTGIASILLDGGHTAHSQLKIPLKCNSTSTCNISLNPSKKNKTDTELIKLIQEAELFVWDEAPAKSKFVYETVDRTFRDIMKEKNTNLEKIPFGGKLIIFSGDFQQLLPVIPHANRAIIIS